MATISICDRCGKTIERPSEAAHLETRFHFVHFSFFGFSSNDDETYEEFDLCADCASKLWDWLRCATKS